MDITLNRRQIMQNEKIIQDILDFNKNAVKMSFDALNSFSDQTAKAADQLMGAIPNVPEEGKKAVGSFFKENQKTLNNLKKSVDAGLTIDWTAQDASAKGIDAMEAFYKSAFAQASEVQEQASSMFKKTTEQLPKEVVPVVEFWNQALNNNFETFQGIVTKNFEFAKKVAADVAAVAPKAKAATN
jgi:ABC-type transporter Mla subunit MlaD